MSKIIEKLGLKISVKLFTKFLRKFYKEEKYLKNEEGKKVFHKETRLYTPEVGYLKFLRSIFD